MLVLNELLFNDNLVKIKIVLEVFEHAESKAGLYSGLYLFLKKVGTDGNFCRLYKGFLKHVRFLVVTRQSGFPELSPYRKQSKMQSILEK